jgi:phosphoenolpyruvate-protein kinase (PTS system EI component)
VVPKVSELDHARRILAPEEPVWSVLFPRIGALLTDTGGILSHAAIIARKYPVVAVPSRDASVPLGKPRQPMG